MTLLSKITQKCKEFFQVQRLPVAKEVKNGLIVYRHMDGDFNLNFETQLDFKSDLVKFEMFYKGIMVERTSHQPSNIKGLVIFHVKSHFISRLEAIRNFKNDGFQRIVNNVFSREEFSDLAGLQLHSNEHGEFDVYRIDAYDYVKRKSFHEFEQFYKFLPVRGGVINPNIEIIDHKNGLFLSTQFRFDDKASKLYENHQLDHITRKINDTLISLKDISSLHIYGLRADRCYFGHSTEIFYSNISDESILLKMNVGTGACRDSVDTKTHFSIYCEINLKTENVNLEVYRYSGGDFVEMLNFDIESRFTEHRPRDNIFEEYRGVKIFMLSEMNVGIRDHGRLFDHQYYGKFFAELIAHLGLKYYPDPKTLALCGDEDFQGELSDEQLQKLEELTCHKFLTSFTRA